MSSTQGTQQTDSNGRPGIQYSTVVKTAVDVAAPVGGQMSWDAYVRLLYNQANKGLEQQANSLLVRGNIDLAEKGHLLVSQRNALVVEFRKPLSPWGKLYSKILKPADKLPTFPQLLAQKGSVEAVLRSVGSNRVVVNRMAVVLRVSGPALVTLRIAFSAIAIKEAPEGQKGRVGAQEVGGMAGGLASTIAGSWAGCLAGASFASPSLVIPGWGELTEGGACLVGGLAGGLGFGWIGDRAGRRAGSAIYGFATSISYWQRSTQ